MKQRTDTEYRLLNTEDTTDLATQTTTQENVPKEDFEIDFDGCWRLEGSGMGAGIIGEILGQTFIMPDGSSIPNGIWESFELRDRQIFLGAAKNRQEMKVVDDRCIQFADGEKALRMNWYEIPEEELSRMEEEMASMKKMPLEDLKEAMRRTSGLDGLWKHSGPGFPVSLLDSKNGMALTFNQGKISGTLELAEDGSVVAINIDPHVLQGELVSKDKIQFPDGMCWKRFKASWNDGFWCNASRAIDQESPFADLTVPAGIINLARGFLAGDGIVSSVYVGKHTDSSVFNRQIKIVLNPYTEDVELVDNDTIKFPQSDKMWRRCKFSNEVLSSQWATDIEQPDVALDGDPNVWQCEVVRLAKRETGFGGVWKDADERAETLYLIDPESGTLKRMSGFDAKIEVKGEQTMTIVQEQTTFEGKLVDEHVILWETGLSWIRILPETPKVEMPVLDPEVVRRCRRTLTIMTVAWCTLHLQAVIGIIVSVKYGSCQDGGPDYLYYALGFIILFVLGWQCTAAPPLSCADFSAIIAFFKCIMDIGLTSPALLDMFTDGQQISTAIACDSHYHERFVDTFRESNLSLLAGLIDHMHLYGLMILSFSVKLGLQALVLRVIWCFASIDNPLNKVGLKTGAHILSRLLGVSTSAIDSMNGHSHALDQEATIAFVEIFTNGFSANIPSLFMSTSLLGLTFEETCFTSKGKQIFSIVLSAYSLIQQFVRTLPCTRRCLHNGWYDMLSQNGIPEDLKEKLLMLLGYYAMMIITLLPMLFAIFVVAVCMTRVYFTFTCASHLWNMSTGCVSVSASL